jgi:hypothetical protein
MRKDRYSEIEDQFIAYAKSLLIEDEKALVGGYATLVIAPLMDFEVPKRCFVVLTNVRLIIIWLKKKYYTVQSIQSIFFSKVSAFSYKSDLWAVLFWIYPYSKKRFTPRLYIELNNKNKLGFAFDDQERAKIILDELERRLKTFQK